MITTIKGITISPSTAVAPLEAAESAPLLSLKDMNKLPVNRSSATQTFNPITHQQATQSTPSVTNKATDSNDLIRLVHKLSMTEVAQKRDQIVHTADLIKFQQIGTNTPPPPIPLMRTTASNTNLITTKSVGVNSDNQAEMFNVGTVMNHQGVSSKIPRPSPMAQRKFVRQETFTVNSTSAPIEDDLVKECPAEKLWK